MSEFVYIYHYGSIFRRTNNHDLSESTPIYTLLKNIPNTSFSQLVVSRLRAEGIDVRIRNSNASSIYPLATIGMQIEVNENQFELAQSLVQEMEKSALEPNPDIDFHEADEEDIAFESAMHKREQEINNAKPTSLIYLLIFLFVMTLLYYFTFTK